MEVKRIFYFLPIFWACLSFGQEKQHVVLISIDGFRPEFYLNEKYETPILKMMMKEGKYSKGVRSVFPSITYPAHTTLITGALPANHGIFFNVDPDSPNNHWNWEANRITTSTIWDEAKIKGITTGAIMWPVSVGAPITYNLPVRRSDDAEDKTQLEITKPFVTPANLIQEMEEYGLFDSEDAFTHDNVDQTIGSIGRFILKEYSPQLLAIHFLNVDHVQHIKGRDDESVNRSINNVDQEIGKTIEIINKKNLKGRTTFIITGDHGFVDVDKEFLPNVLLRQYGLLSKEIWKARFISNGGSAFLYLKNKSDIHKVLEILSAFNEKQDSIFTIVDREELDLIGADPKAALAISMEKKFSVSDSQEGPVIKTRIKGGAHGHFPNFKEIETGFIIWGAQVREHGEITNLNIEDVAPLISEILNLDFKTKNGKLIDDVLK